MRIGAIDCGTNSIRLLIADAVVETDENGKETTRLKDVVRQMRIVRLGQGVDATGWLAQEALDRTFEAAREYAQLLKEHGADRVRFVATSATRDAGNRKVFMEGIQQILGIEPEVISGTEEASLSFAGAMRAVGAGDKNTLVPSTSSCRRSRRTRRELSVSGVSASHSIAYPVYQGRRNAGEPPYFCG